MVSDIEGVIASCKKISEEEEAEKCKAKMDPRNMMHNHGNKIVAEIIRERDEEQNLQLFTSCMGVISCQGLTPPGRSCGNHHGLH